MALLAAIRLLSRVGRIGRDAQEIECRVEALRPFASSTGKDLHIRLAAWQGTDGQFHATPLILKRQGMLLPPSPLWRMALGAKTHFRALIGPTSKREWHIPTARLLRVLGPGSDSEFARRSLTLINPVSYEIEGLGEFRPHPEFRRWFEGEIDWLGAPIKVTFELEEAADVGEREVCASQLRSMLADASGWQERVLARAAEDLHPVWVESGWNGDGPVISIAEWRQRLQLTSIEITSDDRVTFGFDDGDLFWGHWITVSGNFAGEMEEAMMQG